MPLGRVLSIQSHVVHGYVGNKAAVFPLQLLGFDVDVINSVQFSNHTGYTAKWKGQVLNGDELRDLIDGLEANGLLGSITHLLTGYIGSASFLTEVLAAHRRIKSHNPDLVYVCDPVLGDHGRLYVPAELIPEYRDRVLPLASIATPNGFELGLLTGSEHPIDTPSDAYSACAMLHSTGVPTVVVTSLGGDDGAGAGKVSVLLSEDAGAGAAPRRTEYQVEKIGCKFTGSGDLTAALVLGWSRRTAGSETAGGGARWAVGKALAGVAAVLRRTAALAATDGEDLGMTRGMPELRLVESAGVIMEPPDGLVEVFDRS